MKKHLNWITAIVLLVCFALPYNKVSARTESQRLAGTYWMEIFPDGWVDPLLGLMTLAADGHVDKVENVHFVTDGVGSWEKVGSRGVKGVYLGFGFDSAGAHSYTFKVVFEGEIDASTGVGEMDFVGNWYGPDQEPLDEDPVWGSSHGVMYLRRVPVE
jgi:hypothetical protein